MKSLVYSFKDVSITFIGTVSISTYDEALGSINIKPLTLPTKMMSSADGQSMSLKMPGTRTEFSVTTPQVSKTCTGLLNSYEMATKMGSQGWDLNMVAITHRTSGFKMLLTPVCYKGAPELVFTERGTFVEFFFYAESMNVICF